MNELSNALTCRIQLLKRAIKQAEKDGEFPEGRLRVSRTAGRVRYYEVQEKNVYKSKSEITNSVFEPNGTLNS